MASDENNVRRDIIVSEGARTDLLQNQAVMVEQTRTGPLTSPSEDNLQVRRGPSGCFYALMGGLGCLMIPLVLLAAAALIGVTSINSIRAGFQSMFQPTQTINISALVLERVQGLSQLTTARYNIVGVADISRDFPSILNAIYGEQVQLRVVGHAVAGIDLSGLTAEDVTLSEGTLTIRLPPPQLQDCFLDEQETQVLDRDSGPLSSTTGGPDLVAEARRYAIERIRDTSLEDGILSNANAEAQSALIAFFQALPLENVTNVVIAVTEPDPNAPLPSTCQVAE
ncbi:MAG: DUF4230 domain-containing protein [bacterium]|nr:DUF4230 domain-containing protein [bacterium]